MLGKIYNRYITDMNHVIEINIMSKVREIFEVLQKHVRKLTHK